MEIENVLDSVVLHSHLNLLNLLYLTINKIAYSLI